MTQFKKAGRSLVVAALAGLFSATSHSAIISSADNTEAFSWSFLAGAAGLLDGTGSLTVTGWGTDTLTMVVVLNNDAEDASDRLTAFGFGIDPNTKSVSFTDAADYGMIAASLSAIPSLKTIEVCAYGGPNCKGGGNGGILGGDSDTFTLYLTALRNTIWGDSVTIDPIGFKYQTDPGSFEFTTEDGGGDDEQPIPEPGVLFLMGAGLLGLGMARRRKSA